MSVVAAALLLGMLLILLIRVRQVRVGGAVVAVVFGLVLGSTPAGPQVNRTLTQTGSSTWAWVQSL